MAVYIATMALFPGIAWLTGTYVWSLLALLPMTAVALVLDGSVHGITELPVAMLDERQRAQRDEGFRSTYWIECSIGLLGGLTSAWLFGRDQALAAGTLIFTVTIVMGLPAIMLALTMPGNHEEV